MSYEDYSEEEIKNIINELLDTHYSKLMKDEIKVLTSISIINKCRPIANTQRDWLIGLYDRIGEGGY